ncbi:MAG: hypothetical protein K2W97_06470 [Chthoniobacterales bacterium]|nr:hypothetical protein [Chthoniobacterales bacterium]
MVALPRKNFNFMGGEFSRVNNLALTYASEFFSDGLGSQLQCIYGIYALSRFLDVAYIHSPIGKINYQGLAALEKNELDPAFVSRCNEVFHIASDVEFPKTGVVCTAMSTDLDFLCAARDKAKKSDEFHLVRLGHPYPMTDKNPQMMRYVEKVAPFQASQSRVFRMALHVRRGDFFVVDPERISPNAYYIDTALNIIRILKKHKIPFLCELYTELPSKTFTITEEHCGIDHEKIIGTRTITSEMCQLEDFEVLPKLQKFINGDPIEALQSLATADLLIMSRSSFSYVAGVLNHKGIIVSHPLWHTALPHWITNDQGEFFEEEINECCERWAQQW